MYRSIALAISLVVWSFYTHAQGETRYIRDWMSIPLHASALPDSNTVHNGLVSGTAVEVVESNDASGYSRVRTAEGSEGWIATRYLSTEPSTRQQLEKANAELEQLRSVRAQLANLPADARAAAQQAGELRSENTRLQAELDALKKAPTTAADISAENERLRAINTSQQQQLATLGTELQLLRSSDARAQFRDGALAVIGGLLLALCIRRLWPKKRSEWS